MPLPMIVTYKTFRLDCGHEVPAFTWLGTIPTELSCRACGESRSVLQRQVREEPRAPIRRAA